PSGAVGHNTYATAAPNAAAALANPVTYEVSGALLVTGTNVVTAEVHSNYRSTPSASFEMTGLLTLGEQPAVEPEPEPEPASNEVITAGGSWSYYFDTAAPASGWQERDFDDSSWSTGTAPLGWGHANLGTELTFTGTKPLVSYYRSEFTVEDATGVAAMTLT